MIKKSISILFKPLPLQWGLRGDPHLWAALESFFAKTEFPQSEDELETALNEAVFQLIGQHLEKDKHIFVEKFQFGGMSGGMVSTKFWREEAIPLLKKRYTETKKPF